MKSDYFIQPDNQTQPTFEMNPGFKSFTVLNVLFIVEPQD